MVRKILEGIYARRNTIVLEPAGAAKSTWGTRNTLSWLISMFPDLRVGLFSETAEFAAAFSRAIQNTFETNERHKGLFGDLVGPKWTQREWIRKGSHVEESKDLTLFAGGTGGQVASKRFDLFLLDDILGKDNTVTVDQREKTRNWFDLALSPRRAPDGVTVALGTRWAPEDLYEWLLTSTAEGGYGYNVLIRQALIRDEAAVCWEDTARTMRCENPAHQGWRSYWESYWPVHTLLLLREQNAATFDCAYMNDVEGVLSGDLWNSPDLFQYYGTKTGDPREELPAGRQYTLRTGSDLATSLKQRADFTAAVSTAEDQQGNYFVMRAARDKINIGHAGWIASFYYAMPTGIVMIETNQHQSTVATEMARDYPNVPQMPHRTDTDKYTRASGVAGKYKLRKVWHHESLRGSDLEREQKGFPKGHDDLIDAEGLSMKLGGSSFIFGGIDMRNSRKSAVERAIAAINAGH